MRNVTRRFADSNHLPVICLALTVILCGPGDAAQPPVLPKPGVAFKVDGFPNCGEEAIKRGGLPERDANGNRLYVHVEDNYGQDFEVWCLDDGYQYGFFVSHTEYPAGTLPEDMTPKNSFGRMVADEVDRCELPIGRNEIVLGYDPDSSAASPPTSMVPRPAPTANGTTPPLPAGGVAPTPFPMPPPDGKPAQGGTGTIKLPGRLTRYRHHNYSAKEEELGGSDSDFHTIYKYASRDSVRLNTERMRDDKTRKFVEKVVVGNVSFGDANECAIATPQEIAESGILHIRDFDVAIAGRDGKTRLSTVYGGPEEIASVTWNARTQGLVIGLQRDHPPSYLSLALPVTLFGESRENFRAAIGGQNVPVEAFMSGSLIAFNLPVSEQSRQVIIFAGVGVPTFAAPQNDPTVSVRNSNTTPTQPEQSQINCFGDAACERALAQGRGDTNRNFGDRRSPSQVQGVPRALPDICNAGGTVCAPIPGIDIAPSDRFRR